MIWSRCWGACVDVGWGVDGYFTCWEGVKSLLVRTRKAVFACFNTFAFVTFVSIAFLIELKLPSIRTELLLKIVSRLNLA